MTISRDVALELIAQVNPGFLRENAAEPGNATPISKISLSYAPEPTEENVDYRNAVIKFLRDCADSLEGPAAVPAASVTDEPKAEEPAVEAPAEEESDKDPE